MKSLEIGRAICTLLPDVKAVPFYAKEGTKTPFVAYTLTGLQTSDTKDRYNFSEVAQVELAVIGSSYLESIETAQLVRDRLEHFHGEIDGLDIADIRLYNARAQSDGNIVAHYLNYQITLI